VVMRRRIAATKSRKVPIWWKNPVLAISTVLMFLLEIEVVAI
jgi:hypothetical protein